MAKQQPKTTPWNKIKAEYLAGVTPKSLSSKYEIDAKTISNKANKERWTKKKAKISENLEERVQKELEQITELGIARLKELLSPTKLIKDGDLISAIRLGFDTTLLNKKQDKKEDENPVTKIIHSDNLNDSKI